MAQAHILIVDDEAPIRDMIHFALRRANYRVSEAADAQNARLMIAETPPDLILLDWMLPDVPGIELAHELRRDELTAAIAIIMVSARVTEADRVLGLNRGADDYIVKPFASAELIARIRAVLRRSQPAVVDEILARGGLRLNTTSQRVTADNDSVHLGPTEYRLLRFLMAHPERVYSRAQMLDQVWGQGVFVAERTVDVHIRRLRKALAPHGYNRCIETVHGSGYRFAAPAGP